ncbi:MAG TPA: hypothetical protein VF748_15010 [Candidatus Acidoferrum sp.]
MALSSAQIVTLAVQAAKTPGMVAQAGQNLNLILQELCQTYDLDDARGLFNFTFNTSSTGGTNTGTGPYLLPADYLRTQRGRQFYTVAFQPYELTRIELDDYDLLTQQPGFNDFPRNFTVDMSQTPPQELVWPPPSVVATVVVRYFRQMPDISQPETSNVVPWFRNEKYLVTRLTGEMMALADDERAAAFLTDKEEVNPQGAGVLLRRFLNMKDDPEGRAKTVTLDRRRFGISRWDRLPSTKTIGWP